MKRHTVGDIEFTTDDERLSLRYSRRSIRKSAVVLVLMTLVSVALLAYPVREISRGNLLESLTPCVFLLILGGTVAAAATAGWVHLGLFARKPIVFDRGAGTCSIPRWFQRPLTFPLSRIDHVLVRRKRKEGCIYYGPGTAHLSREYTEKTHILLVLRDGPKQQQVQLWGHLGLPNTTRADQVAEQIAEFVGRKLQRRPAEFFK